MVHPRGSPDSSHLRILPPAISTRVPVVSSPERVSSSRRDTLAIDGRASPRKPSVAIDNRSRTSLSLLVAWRSNASNASSRSIPAPSSATRISLRPPASTAIRRSVAPASSEFSSSSLTTEAGRSTTSPAAILLATLSERTRILPIAARRALLHGDSALLQQVARALQQAQQVAPIIDVFPHQGGIGGREIGLGGEDKEDRRRAEVVTLLL